MLHLLSKLTKKVKRRLGQGWGSGAGKYSGRGVKGQHAREKTRQLFEGGQLPLQKKLPMLRGKSKNKSLSPKTLVFDMATLQKAVKIKDGATLTKALLVSAGLLNPTKARKHEVKLVSQGEISKKLIIKVKATRGAVEKIIKAGGEYQL